MTFEPQKQIGKYAIVREIGAGATSRVYLARDPFAERDVAIKVFLFEEHADPVAERMAHKAFLTESSLAGKLNHPHIVDIYDAVIEPHYSYLVMEYVPGVTLEAHSDVTSLLPPKKVVEIIFKCIRALEYAFQHGVIHRDMKPGNILLSERGEAKVADFGASFQHRKDFETTQLSGVGSPAYMSPEQIRMENLTQQTDIYSLGVVMYRLLTGRLPFQVSSHAGLAYAILNAEPSRPATLRPELPALLDDIVMRAMRKDLSERYRSWLDFGKDLGQAFMNLRLAGDCTQPDGHHLGIGIGPHHHRSLAAEIAEIDPGRAARVAVDQHARLLARVMGDVATVPHRADHVDQRLPRRGAKAARDLVGEPVARIEHGAVAVIDAGKHRIVRDKHECEQHEHRCPRHGNPRQPRGLERGARGEHDPGSEEQP